VNYAVGVVSINPLPLTHRKQTNICHKNQSIETFPSNRASFHAGNNEAAIDAASFGTRLFESNESKYWKLAFSI